MTKPRLLKPKVDSKTCTHGLSLKRFRRSARIFYIIYITHHAYRHIDSKPSRLELDFWAFSWLLSGFSIVSGMIVYLGWF